MMEKPTPKKAREKKCSRKKVLSWKASIFSRSELLVQAQSFPGCQSLSSFGSLALQFSFTSWLEANEAPLALHTASKKEREREMETKRERKREWKAVFHAKTTSGVIHGHAWAPVFLFCALPSAPPSLSLCSLRFLMCFSSRSKMLVII